MYFDAQKGKPGKSWRSKWGGFLDQIDQFDPLFFRISLIEAELNWELFERLFLQEAYGKGRRCRMARWHRSGRGRSGGEARRSDE